MEAIAKQIAVSVVAGVITAYFLNRMQNPQPPQQDPVTPPPVDFWESY